ncbi:MAG: hypothetical protein K8L99_19345 [Anaerolineae bacterium]|nr:hypothetical protein [Anaerolineae bacterium]
MSTTSLNQFLLLYGWFAIAALIAFMLLIARFYQNFSGELTHFRWYTLPLFFYGVAIVRYSSINQASGDLLGDLSLGVAGAVLLFLCLHLYRLMTAGRKQR